MRWIWGVVYWEQFKLLTSLGFTPQEAFDEVVKHAISRRSGDGNVRA